MKKSLINKIKTPTLRNAEDILSKAGTEDLFEKAKHQDGDMHPNGKWVWVASANGGKGDWRTHGGRAHSKASGGSASSGSGASTSKTTSATQSSGKSGAAPKPKTQRKLTTSQQRIVDGFMDRVKTSDSRYSDPSKVTLWKTPKGNWYVKYDGHQVATIAPSGLTEKIAEAAGMKIDREPSSYQSSKTKKSTTPKTDKERLDLQQEYATMSQLIKKPSTSAQHKKEFQERMKEIEGMGLKVVKGKFQWKDTGKAATPQSGTTTPKDKKILIDNLQTEHLKNAPEGHTITAEKPGNNQGVYQKYVKLADGYWKNPVTNQRYTNAQMKQRLEGLHKNLYGVDLGGLTESKPKEQKKIRPVGTGTNGPERRRRETKSSKPKYSEMSADDLKKELVGKTLVEEENIKGKKTTRTYEITNVVKFRGRVEIEYASSDEPYVHVLNPKILEDGHDGDMYKYTLK